jgi:hypothetical protein
MLAFATSDHASGGSRVRAREGSKRRAAPCYPDRVADRLDQIADVGRATRTRPSRGLWIAALVIGSACAIAFVVMLFVDTGAPSHESAPAKSGGFSNGLVIGIAVGVVLGWAIARRIRSRPVEEPTVKR